MVVSVPCDAYWATSMAPPWMESPTKLNTPLMRRYVARTTMSVYCTAVETLFINKVKYPDASLDQQITCFCTSVTTTTDVTHLV